MHISKAKAERSQPQMVDRRSVLAGVAMLISSAPPGFSQTNAPKLIILPKGVTSPLRFMMRSPKDPRKIVTLTNIPLQGFPVCNGAVVSRTDYKELFQLIGAKYGAGDGVSTFALPNYPVQYRAGNPIKGMAICPSKKYELPVGVVVPFDIEGQKKSASSQKPQ